MGKTGGHHGRNWWTPWEKLVDTMGNWWAPWEIGGHRGRLVDTMGNWWTPWEIGACLGKLVDITGKRKDPAAMYDDKFDVAEINDSRKITRAVYKNKFTSMFPFVLTDFSSNRHVQQRLMMPKEQKMVIALIACANANGGKEVRLPFDVFKVITGDKRHYSREEYEDYLFLTMKRLQTGFCTYNENTKMMLPLFSRASGVDSSTHEIIFSISDEFIELFNDIKKNFTNLQLSEILPLSGKYAIVLYRLLIQWDSLGQVRIPMSDIAKQMFLSTQYQENTRDITKRIIKPAVEELRKKVWRFRNLEFRYDNKYHPTAIYFIWEKPDEREAVKDIQQAKQLEETIEEVIIESNELQNQQTMMVSEKQDIVEQDQDWKTYVPSEAEVMQYARQKGYDQFSKAKRFIMYCQSKLCNFKSWERAGCVHGWQDYFDVFIEDEPAFAKPKADAQKVALPEYMSKPLPESQQPSEELLDKIRKMQNDFRK